MTGAFGVLLARPYDVLLLGIEKMTDVNPDGATLMTHAWVSLQESITAFVLSLLIGLPLGLLMGWFGVVRGLFRPIFEMWRPIPPVARIPLTIFWFGIGMEGKVFIILLGGMTPCIINAYMGVHADQPGAYPDGAHVRRQRLEDLYQHLHTVCTADGLRRAADRPRQLLDDAGRC